MKPTCLTKGHYLLFFFISAILFMAYFFNSTNASAQDSKPIYIIELDDNMINPVTAEYITKSIDHAAEEGAQCLILKLDTPGGLLNSTRLIVKKILASPIPIIVYVAPSGSRAGSAGVFITYASHIAAMAPSTNIGAAHPVQLDGGGEREKKDDFWDGLKELMEKKKEQEKLEHSQDTAGNKAKEDDKKKKAGGKKEEELTPDDDPMSSKILQDTVAFVKSLAEKRNRNVEWAIKSVTKSSSITETEAKQLGVIEFIAASEQELLDKIDGKSVIIGDQTITLATKGASIIRVSMDFRQKLFNILADPNVAYILLILGFYGLLYEVTHPGIGVPGVLGAIFLILAFYSMQTLPTNYAGVALVILGLVLLISEAFVPGLGLLTLGGVISMILGSLLLFDSSLPMMRVSLSLIFSFTATTAFITLFLLRFVIRAHKSKVISGEEGLIGEKGEAVGFISAEKEGKVFVHGEYWNAVSVQPIQKGDRITVSKVNGMILIVKKI